MANASVLGRLSESGRDFIDEGYLHRLLEGQVDRRQVEEVLAKSRAKQALSPEETAVLLKADDPDILEEIFETARQLKRQVYGNRIVLFAPLYLGNFCVNDCQYCGFRRSNPEQIRRTLTPAEIQQQVCVLEDQGHKRLILVFGEHPRYNPSFIAECVRLVSGTRSGRGEIRRVNINAAPLDHEGYRIVKSAGVGTYQVFQETYHHATYRQMHPADTPKGDYLWRLDALARAMEAGCDDVGLGALFGLYDWRFEVLGLVSHALHLQKHYHCGPHTISFPRLQPAQGVNRSWPYRVSDEDFKRLVAILRLAVPYTGLILTAREPPEIRREVMQFGVSQIDAGSRIELGGYTEAGANQRIEREQFLLGDTRSLDEVIRQLLLEGDIPSFCTACYRLGRTGEQFMEYAVPGFIQHYCTPNALCTLMEYLVDYASAETQSLGEKLIHEELAKIPESPRKQILIERLRRIVEQGERDFRF